MRTRVVDAVPTPMIHVRHRVPMAPARIAEAVGEAFRLLGPFIGEKGIAPLGPPLAVYSDMREGEITVDVGFPVSPDDAARAEGRVEAGETPSGPAMKAVHRGPYSSLHDTYRMLERAIADEHGRPSGTSWEVYFSDPDKTPEAELVTEVYFGLADLPAAPSGS